MHIYHWQIRNSSSCYTPYDHIQKFGYRHVTQAGGRVHCQIFYHLPDVTPHLMYELRKWLRVQYVAGKKEE